MKNLKVQINIALLSGMLLVIQAFPAFADVIYDDDYGTGWTKGTWDVSVDTETTYNNSSSAVRRDNGVSFAVINPAGLDISENPIFQAYVNFIVSESEPGHSITNLQVSTIDGTLFEFDDRSKGWSCYVDGTEYVDADEIVFDNDPNTWQLFEIDLSQTDYFGWPYQSRELGDSPITSIKFGNYGNTTGTSDMYVDNAKLIPEPATMALVALGGVMICVRKGTRKRKKN